MARKKEMKPLRDDEIPNVLALGRQIAEEGTGTERQKQNAKFWADAAKVTLEDPACHGQRHRSLLTSNPDPRWMITCSTTGAPANFRSASGPLAGFRIVEFAGIGPGPFACMLLADMGAEVVTLDRVGAKKNLKAVATRGRKVVELDLKDKAAIAQVLDLVAKADALIEGFRPGVMERLGLGPDVC